MSEVVLKNPKWLSGPEIENNLSKLPHSGTILEAFALKGFFANAIYDSNYKASQEWSHIVALSPAGEDAMRMADMASEFERAEIMMAAFYLFFHLELFIDVSKCDLKGIQKILNDESLAGKLKWPQRFGRHLYDKFNNTYKGDRTDHLLAEEAITLLDGTPQGVYQIGHFVSGPLGIIRSSQLRYIPPTRSPLLWHCSDPGCGSPHEVELLVHEIPVRRIARKVRGVLQAQLGPASEWSAPLANIVGLNIPREPYTYFDTCALIADCILDTERSSLLTAALSENTGTLLRETLSIPPRKKTAGQGAPEIVAKNLSSDEQLQLLFLLKDSELIALLDKSIKFGSIKIPSAEVRTCKASPPHPSRTKTSELSSLGIRCAGDEALVDLCALVWDSYSSTDRITELDWRLRNRTGANTCNVLLDFLCQNDPNLAVKELVLASEPITKIICDRLKCSYDDVGDAKIVDRILWKLGFDLPRFSGTLSLLRRRLDLFSQELLAVGVLNAERDRERIRSVGVNLFVSIEEFLERLVAYNVWALSSDHFLKTRFIYDPREAKHSVAAVLGQTIKSGEENVFWNSKDTNTLGTLIAYLNAAAKWIRYLLGSDRDVLLRAEKDMPHFANDKFRVFLLRHTALWADSDYGALERFCDGFENIVKKLSRSNIAAIRNGLDHQRNEADFPKVDEMLAFVAHFREGLDGADINRYFPKEFWLEKIHADSFGRIEYSFYDYLSRKHVLYGPSIVHEFSAVGYGLPLLILPGNLLGYTNAEIIFKIQEVSVYTDYWDGYPRRREIPIAH